MRQVFIIAILLVSMALQAQEKTDKEDCKNTSANAVSAFNPAFAHTVYFWLKHPDSQADRDAFVQSLQKFLDHSKYARTCFIGTPPRATRDVVDGSFTYSLIVSFPSAEAQEKYQEEEAHKIFIQESAHLWKKVIVYDSVGVKPGSLDEA